jgi:Phage minor capsid protein 2.
MADYDAKKAFAKIENELLESMMRNMKRHRAEETKEGFQWEQWQVVQLKALNDYRKRHERELGERYALINQKIRAAILQARAEGRMAQERKILDAILQGAELKRASEKMVGEFFRVNEKKMGALLDAVENDMRKAEAAILRKHNDEYRKIIFDAQVYANSGAGTYEKAVDMAVKDYAANGINCIKYSNGRQVNIKDYADMALRTAGKRAYLAGEGEKRQEWGIHTVIMNKRGNPCPKCLPWVGRVLIDDVWSGGTAEEGREMGYPLMSQAMAAGLYHPRCKDSHSTYFEGISRPPQKKWTKEELAEIERNYKREQRKRYAGNQAEKYERLESCSLDADNKKIYTARKREWMGKAGMKKVDNPAKYGIIKKNGDKIMMNLQLFAEKDILNQESSSLKKAIRKYHKRIEEHEYKISNPADCFPEWQSYSIERQEGLKRHWKKEIKTFRQSIDDRVEELKKRGDYHGEEFKQ